MAGTQQLCCILTLFHRLLRVVSPKSEVELQVDLLELMPHYPGKGKTFLLSRGSIVSASNMLGIWGRPTYLSVPEHVSIVLLVSMYQKGPNNHM